MSGRPRVGRVKVSCERCGKGIEKYPRQIEASRTGRFFCSMECRSKVGSKPRRRAMRTCEQCQADFYPTFNSNARFCSKACYDKWQRRKRVERTCENCGKVFDRPPAFETRQKARFCSRKCEAASRIKRPLERVHNGKPAVLDRNGYVRIYKPEHPRATKGGWIFEHRFVVEQQIQRQLEPEEHVHHVNGLKDDNRLENLVVMTHGEHSSITGLINGDRLREWAEYRRRYGPLETSGARCQTSLQTRSSPSRI